MLLLFMLLLLVLFIFMVLWLLLLLLQVYLLTWDVEDDVVIEVYEVIQHTVNDCRKGKGWSRWVTFSLYAHGMWTLGEIHISGSIF